MKLLKLCFIALLFNLSNSYAEELIREILVEGNERTEVETILNYLELKPNDLYDETKANNSVKKLHNTGLFANVEIKQKENKLIVLVKENAIINKITFEGNKRIKRDQLISEIILKPRSIYNKIKLKQDTTHLIELYHKSGRYNAKVIPKTIDLPENRVDLVFEIDEGQKTPVKKILFIGNKKFSDQKLKTIISSKEEKWYRFFSSSDNLDLDRVEIDKEFLRKFYNATGYADFKIVSASAELLPKRDGFIITYSIEEGECYNFGEVTLESKIDKINTEPLKKLITASKGDVYNYDLIEDSSDNITKSLNEEGFAFINVDILAEKDDKDKIITVNFVISESPKIFIDRINITGNTRTYDKVIRREFRASEGDPYNASQIHRSEQRIRNLDYFDKIQLKTERTNDPSKVNVNLEVEEKSTARFNFGVGYSTLDKAIGQISFNEDNLLGRGQKLELSFRKASKTTDIDFSFTEPYFMDLDVAAGIDLFKVNSEKRMQTPYKLDSRGSVIRAGYSLSEHLRHNVRYTLKSDKISDIDKNASFFVKEQKGNNTVSAVGHSFIYNKTDNDLNPKSGYLVKFDQEYAGIGGTAHYLRNELNTRSYRPLIKGKPFILQLSANVGNISRTTARSIRIDERFFVGNVGRYGLRGFDDGGIGPRDIATKDPLGGNSYYTTSAAVNFPIGLPSEIDLSGSVFVDAGSLFGLDMKKLNKQASLTKIHSDHKLRASAGVGLVLGTKLGPVRVDLSEPFLRRKYDVLRRFNLSFSTDF